MTTKFDPTTGEILNEGGVDVPGRPLPSRKGRAPRIWETAPDGTRRRRTLTKSEIAALPPEPRRAGRANINNKTPFRYEIDDEGKRVRRELTPDELRHREEAKATTEARRAEERVLLASLIPAPRNPGDPPPVTERIFAMDERTARCAAELAVCARPNGSRLRLVARFYDGQARTGHRPLAYVSAYVIYTAPNGLPFRTRGVMFERGELRIVGRALLDEADRLDRLEAAGELPDFLMSTSGHSANGHDASSPLVSMPTNESMV